MGKKAPNIGTIEKIVRTEYKHFREEGTYIFEETTARYSEVIKHALKEPKTAVLDVGCGSGVTIRTIASLSGPGLFVGGDIVDDSLAINRALNDGVHYLKIDLERPLPFKSNSFDTIIASEVIEHLIEPDVLFSEVGRLLKNKGKFIITAPNLNSLAFIIMRGLPRTFSLKFLKLAGFKAHNLPSMAAPGEHFDNPASHKRDGFSKKDYTELGKKHNLDMTYYQTFRFPVQDSLLEILPKPLEKFIVSSSRRFFPLGLENFVVYSKGC